MSSQIAISANTRIADLRGLPRESIQEYLARGGKILVIPWRYVELPTRRVFPTHHNTDGTWPDHDWKQAG